MKRIKIVEESRDDALRRARAIADKANQEKRNLTPSEQTSFDELINEVDDYNERINELKNEDKRSKEAETQWAEIASQAPTERRAGELIPTLTEYRTVSTTTGAGFVPTRTHSSFFDQLRNRTSVLAANPVMINVMGAGSIEVPTVTSSVTVSGYEEAETITPSDPGLGVLSLDPKKFAAFTRATRESLEDSRPELRQVLGSSLLRDLSVALDKQMVAGDGTGNNLTGLRHIPNVTAGPDLGTDGGVPTFETLADIVGAFESANLDADRAAWFLNARTWNTVRKLVDNQNRPIVSVDPSKDVSRRLWGMPVYLSNNLPVDETQGASTDCSSILLCDMSQIVVAVSRQIEVLFDESLFFQSDEVAIKASGRFDIGAAHPEAIVLTTGVRSTGN